MLVFYCKPRNGKLLDPIPKEFLIVEDIFSVPHVDSILSESFLRKGWLYQNRWESWHCQDWLDPHAPQSWHPDLTKDLTKARKCDSQQLKTKRVNQHNFLGGKFLTKSGWMVIFWRKVNTFIGPFSIKVSLCARWKIHQKNLARGQTYSDPPPIKGTI